MAASLTLPARSFFKMCVLKGLAPRYSQVTVGCPRARLATKCDVKCVDQHGRVVIIENKVGYANNYKVGHAMMRHPYSDRTNSCFNQHQIQLALTTALHRIHFPGQSIAQCMVWKYDAQGVTVYPLEDWARSKAAQVIDIVARSR